MLSEEKMWSNVRKLYRRLGTYKIAYDFKNEWWDVLKWEGVWGDTDWGSGFSRETNRTELRDAKDYVYKQRYQDMLRLKNNKRQRSFIIPPNSKNWIVL